MTHKKIEAGHRAQRGADLGVEMSLVATLSSEFNPPHYALQARKLATRFGFTPERARVVAAMAFSTEARS